MWMRVDDGLHAHRKTRAATKGTRDSGKRRDASAMGLWVLAGSWSGRNNQVGWIPCDELDRFDDEWEALADRLIGAGFWWPEERDGEDGYGFNDWGEWNNPTGPSASGTFGNHKRWHVDKGIVKDDCDLCPKEPDAADEEPDPNTDHRPDIAPTSGRPSPRVAPDIGSDIAPDSHPTSLRDRRPDSLTRPDPTRARPEPKDQTLLSDESDHIEPNRFDEFWETYSHKVGRAKAEKAYATALKKPGVTSDLLIASAAAYITWQMSEGKHPEFTKHPTTWLHGEHWRDERPARPAPSAPVSNAQRWLALANETAETEGVVKPFPRQLGGAS